MSINFPTSLDTLSNPIGTDLLENATAALDHDVQHSNANDAIEALEAKVGINSSAVTTSHDYKLSAVTGTEKALTSGTSTQSVTDLTLVTPQINFGSDAVGDMIYRNGSGVTSRLPIGTSGQIIQVSGSGIPEWIANPAATDASTTVKGVVEEATLAETLARTGAGGTSARLFVNPTNLTTVQTYDYAASSGGSDTYAITVSPAPTAYVTGQVFRFKADVANTGAATLNVNSLGAKTIKKQVSADLTTGDILANQIVEVIYDGTNMQLVSLSSSPVAYATGQTSRAAGAGDGDITIAHGLGVTPKFIRITASALGISNTKLAWSVGTATSTSSEQCQYFSGDNGVAFATGQDASNILFVDSGTGTEQWSGNLSTLDSTNIVITADITGAAGTLYIQWEAFS